MKKFFTLDFILESVLVLIIFCLWTYLWSSIIFSSLEYINKNIMVDFNKNMIFCAGLIILISVICFGLVAYTTIEDKINE